MTELRRQGLGTADKSAIETAINDVKSAIEATMPSRSRKRPRPRQSAMKLGEAMYKASQAGEAEAKAPRAASRRTTTSSTPTSRRSRTTTRRSRRKQRMSKRDFYEVLGVPRGSDEKTLKAAFRKLAMQFHPDRNNGDQAAEVKFKEVNAAYECLRDPQKRAAYDRFGHAAFEQGGGPQGFNTDFAASMSNIFDDIFGDFMGGGRRSGARSSGGRERGSDLRYNMEISLEEAYLGKTAEIEVPTKVVCQSCSGSGAKRGSSPKVCPSCEGSGRVRAASGYFSIERTCPTCQGRGEVISDPCLECNGAGRVTEERKLSVNIPAGIEDGTRIRLGGEGEAGLRGGPPGDLYIFLSIRPHEFFQRDGADIFCRVPISFTTPRSAASSTCRRSTAR
jgi:molecular chaperone DnaJ